MQLFELHIPGINYNFWEKLRFQLFKPHLKKYLIFQLFQPPWSPCI